MTQTDINDLTKKVIDFRDERDWKQFHNPKDLAISLSLEASELLENFQWKTSEEAKVEKLDNIKEELADVVIYSMMLANDLEIDLGQEVNRKLEKNGKNYPVRKAKGNRKKYTDF